MSIKKVGILTSGGDCQGLNAAIRGVCKSLYGIYGEENIEIYGIVDGYRGLINCEYRLLKREEFSGILNLGGTILGTSREPFKKIRDIEKDNIDKLGFMKETYKKLKLDCLVILGGNGTHKTANLLSSEGLNVITLPKTIDNDLFGTDVTFGFHSAVGIASQVIDCIHTTATSHGRIFIIEIMGNKVGWLTLYSGIASGADIILIPEIPYNLNSIIKSLENRSKQGKKFSIIAMAEGSIPSEYKDLSKSERKEKLKKNNCSTISYKLAGDLEKAVGQEIRVTVPGHFQRGGDPCPYDRILATRFGSFAAKLFSESRYGNMVSLQNERIVAVPLKDVAGKLKTVPEDSQIVLSARRIGTNFGD